MSVTFLLLAYNQSQTVRAAVETALMQGGQPIQIILSDDCSTDDTFAQMEGLVRAYTGHHAVKARRSQSNLGLVGHLFEAAGEATGDLLILAAGDDISAPERASELSSAWESAGRPTATLYSDFIPIDADGVPIRDFPEKIYRGPHSLERMAAGHINVLGATTAITKDLLEHPFCEPVRHEDRVFPFRTLLKNGQIIFVDRPLVSYRTLGGVSRSKPTSGRDFLGAYTLASNTRTLPDARQRAVDLSNSQFADRPDLQSTCAKAIATQEALIALAGGGFPERGLLQGLMKGAEPRRIVGHYAKLRAGPLFDRYYARRFG